MIRKYLICPQRRRYVPKQFSWVDHRLVRHRYICGCSSQALALYLFLITVSDLDGLSYYSDSSICKYLNMNRQTLLQARRGLIAADLIEYQEPLYQVLALDNSNSIASTIGNHETGNRKNDDGDEDDQPIISPSPVKPPTLPTKNTNARTQTVTPICDIINTIIKRNSL